MPRGGKRPGAGKPKGYRHAKTLEKIAVREQYVQRIEAEWAPIITAQLDAAKGYYYMFARMKEPDKKTGELKRTGKWTRITNPEEIESLLNHAEPGEDYHRIFTRDPDVRMLVELNAQMMGKPIERHEVTGANGEAIVIRWKS